jgi:tetratricopeptide (TPR) repeat protein
MLSEEALILIAVVGACALLVLGIVELIWPSKPRHPMRRSKTPVAKPAPPAELVGPAPPTQPATQAAPVRRRRSKVSPHARPHPGGSVVAETAVTGTAVAGPVDTGAARSVWAREAAGRLTPEASPSGSEEDLRNAPEGSDMPAPPAAELPPEAPPRAKPEVDPLLVETCFSLYQERCYTEVISLGEAALAKVRPEALTQAGAHDAAALWSVVALGKQALGDDEGALAALQAALDIAPPEEWPMYRQHVAALALNAAQAWLAHANSHETDDRVGALRTALVWVERGLAAVPADDRLHDVRVAAHQALWPAYEQSVHKLLQRQDFEEARRLLREALDDPGLPASRIEEFQELFSGTFGGEIGQLTAQAIRSVQEERESEALASLQRAEELLAAIPAEALPPKRREEVDQRLWWGYTRLGLRRVESGEYEAALEPLVHALRFADIGPDRQEETRAALVRALDGVADVRALSIRQLVDEGNHDEAVLRTEAFRELLRQCIELGVSEDDLSVAFARTRRLFEELGMEDDA